jgi:secondary thiamine-phosphate synthase enzyme
MASASVKAPEQPTVDISTGPYRVASTMIKVQSKQREELQNLTSIVRQFVKSSGVREGSVTILSLHTTSAIFINEWQDALIHDVQTYLSNAINKDVYYRHNDPAWSDCDRHNADSHLRSLMLGISLTLPITGGDVVLGEWQSIIMAEFDGPRDRSIRIQAMGIGAGGPGAKS